MSAMSPRRSWLVTLALLGALCGAAATAGATPPIQLFDANIRYTSGIFVPVTAYTPASVAPFITTPWTHSARSVSQVAADGVSLVLVRILAPRSARGAVHVDLVSEHADADPGSLWAVDDQSVVDQSQHGGTIDGPPVSRTTLEVPTLVIAGRRHAFLLYRAPRNFDSATGSTTSLASRPARLILRVGGRFIPTITESFTIVRPLVVFVHGTSADNDAWSLFPLWQASANELRGYAPPPSGLPFAVDRISYNWIWNATGGVVENAESILSQLVAAVRSWREATGTAATQADVVTHSLGGFVARQAAQTQPDPDPLTRQGGRNFRAAANWGHGPIHKLITLAATHRGSAAANASAFLNRFGNQAINNGVPALNLRGIACAIGLYIDRGAIRDQLVLSDALRALRETRLPGHAIVGSGRAVQDPSFASALEETVIATLFDTPGGPYATAFRDPNCPLDALANFTFNLDASVPPVTGSGIQCAVAPDYDLVVSAYSSQGLLPASATTTAVDLGQLSGLDLIGALNHSALHDPASGSPEIVAAVSDRIVFLLQRATTSPLFSHFPAVASVPPTALEERFSQVDPGWLDGGGVCPAPQYAENCPAYSKIKVVPEQLVLGDSTPTPVYVYGELDGQWVLVRSPTFLALEAAANRNCLVTLASSDPGVVTLFTNEVTTAQAAIAAGVGKATIEVTVQGFPDRIAVPVTVEGIGP